MTTPTTPGKKILTQQELKTELEKLTPAQAVTNLKNLINYAMQKGIIDNVDKVLTLEKSIDVLQQAVMTPAEADVQPAEPLPVPANMALSGTEEQQMIK